MGESAGLRVNEPMKKADFARLCGVSAPMIRKYELAGAIVLNGDGVDAAASLRALQGRLDEDKRTSAVLKLIGADAPSAAAKKLAAAPATDGTEPFAADPIEDARRAEVVELARFQRERGDAASRRAKIEADRAEIELLQLTGRLVDIDEIRRAIDNAVSTFWTESQRCVREDADAIATALGLDEFRARQLRAELGRRSMRMRQDFAAALSASVKAVSPAAD